MQQVPKAWASLGLSLALTFACLPSQASEVVKLARLVMSGKRTATEPPRSSPPEPRSPSAPQAHGSGGSDEAGNAPTPSRGIS